MSNEGTYVTVMFKRVLVDSEFALTHEVLINPSYEHQKTGSYFITETLLDGTAVFKIILPDNYARRLLTILERISRDN